MYFNGNKSVIETDDLAELRSMSVVYDKDTGEQLLQLVFKLNDDKQYAPGETPASVHVTNGVRPRQLAPTDPATHEAPPAAASSDASSSEPKLVAVLDNATGSEGVATSGAPNESGADATSADTSAEMVATPDAPATDAPLAPSPSA